MINFPPLVQSTDSSMHHYFVNGRVRKIGIAGLNRAHADRYTEVGAGWLHSWHMWNPTKIERMERETGVHVVPMVWRDRGPAFSWGSGVRHDAMTSLLQFKEPRFFLFLNEPDFPGWDGSELYGYGQADMRPKEAALFWAAIMKQFPHHRFSMPQVSHDDYLNGWPWMRSFLGYALDRQGKELQRYSTIKTPLPAVGAFHTYLREDPRKIIDSYFELMQSFNLDVRRVYISEFGNPSPQIVEEMLAYYLSKQERRIWGAAYYSMRLDENEHMNLIYPDGRLSPHGKIFKRLLA